MPRRVAATLSRNPRHMTSGRGQIYRVAAVLMGLLNASGGMSTLCSWAIAFRQLPLGNYGTAEGQGKFRLPELILVQVCKTPCSAETGGLKDDRSFPHVVSGEVCRCFAPCSSTT